MIISGGLNVYPREVELALEDHAAVDKAAVAFVVPAHDGDIDHEELTAHARERLSTYKCPKRFFTIEQLPRNEMGKVLRDELAHMAGKRA
jgi:malonyl-CoA/methylmalonyl-CoA synthetase